MKERHDEELSALSQQLLNLQACMLRERERVESLLREKDALIQKQKLEIDRLKTTLAANAPATGMTPSGSSPGVAASAAGSTTLFGGGSLRLHGSFRQYKKVRQQLKTSSSNSGACPKDGDRDGSTSSSSGVNVNSSDGDEETSSSSPSTLPRAMGKTMLRQTVSSSIRECGSGGLLSHVGSKTGGSSSVNITTITSNTTTNSNFKRGKSHNNSSSSKKGILKPCNSTGDNPNRPTSDILEKLTNLIEPGSMTGSMRIKVSPATTLSTAPSKTKTTITSEIKPESKKAAKTILTEADKSDSGRESDENVNVSVVTISPSTPKTSSTSSSSSPLITKANNKTRRDRNSLSSTVSTDSANSSFDASDPTLAWKLNVSGPMSLPSSGSEKPEEPQRPLKPVKKAKPPPPPRSSQTKLTSTPKVVKPKSILSPTSRLNTAEISPTEALDNLIHNVDKVKFGGNGSNPDKKLKRVKFNPKVEHQLHRDVRAQDGEQVKPLDPNFLHFLPKLSSGKEIRENDTGLINLEDSDDNVNNSNISYYEPYI